MAATSSESHEVAGRKGLGLLSLTTLLTPDDIAARIGRYRQALLEAEPIGAMINPRVAVSQLVHCAPTTVKAQTTAAAPIMWFHEQVFAFARPFVRDDVPASYRYLQGLQGVDPSKITFEHLLDQHMIIVGDPVHCIERLYSYYEAGVDLVLCMMQLHTIPHATVMESIRLFGEHVIPHFASLPQRVQKPAPCS
jgi:alkanesulfonate monooxygenase SsuD/methylene tetrahydromethanopterin reductase-like flavin-dependent oxidoreductase (luciferase family)